MRRKLRSNLAPGTPVWAGRRAQWRALGLTDADMEKPKIAVVNTSSELAICFSHLDGVARIVKEAIREAGGVFGVFSLFGSPVGAIPLLAISGLIFWRVQKRRKALMGAVTSALTTVRMEA